MPNRRILQSGLSETPQAESSAVVILAAMICALVCVVGLIAAGRCACRHLSSSSEPTPAHISGSRRRRTNKVGLKKEDINSLPKFNYPIASTTTGTTTATTTNDADGGCAICLGDFAAGEELRALPGCGHAFHVACIDPWLSSQPSCPTCRHVVFLMCQHCGLPRPDPPRFPAVIPFMP